MLRLLDLTTGILYGVGCVGLITGTGTQIPDEVNFLCFLIGALLLFAFDSTGKRLG